jgi:hypothetical protein
MPADLSYEERHFRIGDIARILCIGRETARQMFLHEKDVLHIRMGKKNKNSVMVIPEHVLRRVYTRLTNGDTNGR